MAYKVERAVILAAGRGKRLGKFTKDTPKPLLIYNGVAIIESIIKNLHEHDIKEVYIVVGYLSLKFEYLINKYKVKFIFNDKWDVANNIVSVYCAKNHLKNCLVINGDAIMEKNVFKITYKGSTMYADFSKKISKEWELILDETSTFVTKINKDGGSNILQHREVSFICSSDTEKFIEILTGKIQEKKNLNEYFEFSLLEAGKIYVEIVPYNSIFDIDSEDEWQNYLNTIKK